MPFIDANLAILGSLMGRACASLSKWRKNWTWAPKITWNYKCFRSRHAGCFDRVEAF